jgi:ketosteroid isomerase-like protein
VDGVGVMSSSESENVQLARAAVDAFNRGDVEWMLERVDDDFEFDWTRSRGPLAGIYRGKEGFREFINEQWSAFETFVMEPKEFIDRGRHVVVPNTVRAQGRSGIQVSADVIHVFTLGPDGRVVRVTMYQELEEALAATVE